MFTLGNLHGKFINSLLQVTSQNTFLEPQKPQQILGAIPPLVVKQQTPTHTLDIRGLPKSQGQMVRFPKQKLFL